MKRGQRGEKEKWKPNKRVGAEESSGANEERRKEERRAYKLLKNAGWSTGGGKGL